MSIINSIKSEINNFSSSEKAKVLSRFFKTGPGQYGEGDKFIGVKVPEIRKIAKKYKDLSNKEIISLLENDIHEYRLRALIIMVLKMRIVSDEGRKELYDLYLENIQHINNWDLVDLSCYEIVGAYLEDKSRKPLYNLARSKNIWERRTAIVSTYKFIRKGDLDDTFKISEILLDDECDLIHKAVGWMLREAGKSDLRRLEGFLDDYAEYMPRTTLRYSIERMDANNKARYMKVKKKSKKS
jgi:3-methyladenine DNA glycosylase AlkD